MRTNQQYYHLMKSEIIHPTYYSFTMDSSKMDNYGYFLPFKIGTYTTVDLGTFTIDWGDNTSTTITDNVITRALMTHSYTKNTGTYEIKITSSTYRYPEIYFDSKVLNDYYHTLKTINTILPPLYLANGNRQTDIQYAFINCSGLTSLPTELFMLNNQLTYFQGCFVNCSGLTTISSGLLKYNINAYGFGSLFRGCSSLTSIPNDLFKNNTKIKDFSECFSGCSLLTSIPTDLFKYNTLVDGFSDTFRGCSSLTSIPNDLFRYNTLVTTFRNCFINCSSLTSVPQYLFRYNTLVTNFRCCFEYCYKLTLNPDIFCDSTTEKTTRFAGKSINFTYCFLLNPSTFTGTQGTAPDLWNYTFGSVTSTSCFTGHSTASLTNYNDIPSEWK